MFVLHLTYKVPLIEVDHYITAHRDYLDYHYKQGHLIASGPLTPRTGGIIIVAMKTKQEVNALIQQDPFYLAEIADYSILEFTPIKHCTELTTIIQNTEGQLC